MWPSAGVDYRRGHGDQLGQTRPNNHWLKARNRTYAYIRWHSLSLSQIKILDYALLSFYKFCKFPIRYVNNIQSNATFLSAIIKMQKNTNTCSMYHVTCPFGIIGHGICFYLRFLKKVKMNWVSLCHKYKWWHVTVVIYTLYSI